MRQCDAFVREIGATIMKTLIIIVSFVFGLMPACAAHRAQAVGQTGFLQHYEHLKPGEVDGAVMVYRKPDADMRGYKNIVIDPVKVVLRADSDARSLDLEELTELAKTFHEELVKEIAPIYPMASVAGPESMRLRVAITDVVPGSPVRGVLSVLPVGAAIAGATKMATGEYADVGKVEVEMELVDAASGERLGAAVDRRVGTKAPFRGSYDDAMDAFSLWARRIASGLTMARAQT
ncbi:MAG: DUF3313 domain-containing protein [Desulfovibrio sp.]|nr:DUF3313 domain-containing protein [Desulfovibrio sp.]